MYFPPKEPNLCVSLIASSVPLGIILVRQIHDHLGRKHCFDFKFPFFLVWLSLSTILLTTYLPLAICIDCSLRSAVEDVAWANIAACLVVVRRMRVAAEKNQFSNKKCSYSKSNNHIVSDGTLSLDFLIMATKPFGYNTRCYNSDLQSHSFGFGCLRMLSLTLIMFIHRYSSGS